MKIARLIKISRPALWPWLAGPYLVGIGSIKNFSILSLLEFILFLFPLNLFIYGINDVYDQKSDKINPRKGDFQGSILRSDEFNFVLKASIVSALIFLTISILSVNIEHIFLSLLFIFAGFAYSHGNFRFKEIPFVDSIIGGPIIYLLPGIIAFSLKSSLFSLPPKIFLLALPFIAFHAVTTLKDERYDKKAGMNSIGIFLGRANTILLSSILVGITLATFIFYRDVFLVSILGIIFAQLLFFLFSKAKNDDELIMVLSSTFVTSYLIILAYYILRAIGY